MAEPVNFEFFATARQHAHHYIYDPFVLNGSILKPRFGLTILAEALPSELAAEAFIQSRKDRKPHATFGEAPYLVIGAPLRPEVDHVSGWELVEKRLRQAAARNLPRDWIFQGRSLQLKGVARPYGPEWPNYGNYERLGIKPTMLRLTLEKVTLL